MSGLGNPSGTSAPFRKLERHEVEGLVFAAHLAFAEVLNEKWSVECARNFVQGLLDGELLEVFDHARGLLASPTRKTGVVVVSRRAHLIAAALATIAYVDTVATFDSAFQRWAALARCGVPFEILHAAELVRRGQRGEVTA